MLSMGFVKGTYLEVTPTCIFCVTIQYPRTTSYGDNCANTPVKYPGVLLKIYKYLTLPDIVGKSALELVHRGLPLPRDG